MEQAEDKKMIAEMKDFLADKAKADKNADDAKAEENLPFESIDSYSTDPVGFGEMSLRMLSRVEFVFDLAVKENRFSSKYLKRCIQLEKGIKYLGSLCVTKYALQTQGQTFPQLGQLSTEKLYCMTSHHFRKLDQAVSEHMFEHRDVPDKLFDMELRYFNLLERLRSTEVKIEKFHDRYIFGPEDYSPIIHGLAFSEKSHTRSIHRQYDEAPAFRQAPAFSAYGGKLSGVSDQGAGNEEVRMKKEDGVRSRTCEGSDSGANCSKSLGEEEKKVSGVSGQGSGNEERIEEQGPRIEDNEEGRMKNEEQGAVISGQGAGNEEVRMKNEEQGAVTSGQGSGNEEAPVSASRPSTCQREQLSKAGTTRKVAEELHKNEEGRSKNEERIEEQGPRIEENEERVEDQGARIEQPEAHGDCHPADAKSAQGTFTSDAPLPPCLEIMKRVMERSRNSDDHSLTFTIDEMEFLAADPLFARLDPRLASDLRKILEKGPPE